jgi:hypothetical protein
VHFGIGLYWMEVAILIIFQGKYLAFFLARTYLFTLSKDWSWQCSRWRELKCNFVCTIIKIIY